MRFFSLIFACLIPKTSSLSAETLKFRLICIIANTVKLYMLCLVILLESYTKFDGNIAYGGRGGYSAIELIMILRILIEKSLE